MKEYIINKNDSGQRVDKFISKALPKLPKSMMYKLFRKKDIKLNGRRCEGSDILSENDKLTLYIKDDFCSSDERLNIKNADNSSDINIVYEDENILVVDKPVGLVVHTDNEKSEDTLINRILIYLIRTKQFDPQSENSFVPALCNRLDKNTSGLVIAAKNSASLREINTGIKERNCISKKYICVTSKRPPKESDILTAFHKKDSKENKVLISDKFIEGYKKIITEYKVLNEKNELSLTEVHLITGRTHQIRAHLAHINAPLLGDNKYGNPHVNKKYNCRYQALCAYKLEFNFNKNSFLYYLNDIKICCEIPEYMKKYFK